MNKAKKIIKLLKKNYSGTEIRLAENRFQLLIATILSARTNDKQTLPASKKLFKKFSTPKKLAEANLKEIEECIKTLGIYKTKALRIKKTAQKIEKQHNGKVPDSMEELLKLPGVGRKTANIVLSKAFGKTEGIAVDTHVFRVSRRLGIAKGKTAKKVEIELMKAVPKKHWNTLTDKMIFHGRELCKAQRPKCSKCFLKNHCEYMKIIKSVK